MSDAPFIHDDDDADDADDRPGDPNDESAYAALAARHQADTARLSQRHIKAVLAEKRALYRHRTYLLLGAVVCLVAAGQLGWIAFPLLRAGQVAKPIACLIVGAGCLWGGYRLWRQAALLQRELLKPHPAHDLADQPTPDFSTLNNGSQFAQNLEQMRDEE